MSYAELAVTSKFSFLRGGSHAEELVARAAELGARNLTHPLQFQLLLARVRLAHFQQ